MIPRPFVQLRPFLLSRPVYAIPKIQGSCSVIAIYQSFPTALLCYNCRTETSLFDYKKLHLRETDPVDDAIEVAKNGLVYPATSERLPFSNGATLMPNTFMMQMHIRTCIDQHIDARARCLFETPTVYRILKGTPIPSYLTLFHEHTARFSLQPSRPMPLNDLNRALDDFFEEHAEKMTAEQWLKENNFSSAVEDAVVEVWMNQPA